MSRGPLPRVDHVVLATGDVDAGAARLEALGFSVVAGGRHPGVGTRNALVRFGLDYLELIGPVDAGEMRDSAVGRPLLEYLSRSGGGWAGFAVAAPDLDSIAARWSAPAVDPGRPVAMERARPDGSRLAWRLLVPSGSPWRKPWPFLIDWAQPDSERLELEPPGAHRNGIGAVASIAVLVPSVDAAASTYRDGFGLTVERSPSAGVITLRAGVTIQLIEPAGRGQLEAVLEADGPGVYAVALATPNVAHTLRVMGDVAMPAHFADGAVGVRAEAFLGARLDLVERPRGQP